MHRGRFGMVGMVGVAKMDLQVYSKSSPLLGHITKAEDTGEG
jgi:hypothetical protein